MEYYQWIVAFHVMSVISWMAALFYLPRLFVYHREHADNAGFVEVVKIQEYKLFKYIGVPAMWASVLSGATMLWLNPELLQSGGWMHAKLVFVALLIAYHVSLNVFRKKLAVDATFKTGKWYRWYNEVPTLLMIGIVTMVIVRPF